MYSNFACPDSQSVQSLVLAPDWRSDCISTAKLPVPDRQHEGVIASTSLVTRCFAYSYVWEVWTTLGCIQPASCKYVENN